MTSPADRARELLGDRGRADMPLGPLTTYRVGGRAAVAVQVEDPSQLAALAEVVGATGVETLVVGKGSNLLVSDRGFDGLAVLFGDAFAEVTIGGGRAGRAGRATLVRAGGAASYPVVARRTASAGLTGLEWAVGVPGSVGGAVWMNAGGHGSDTASVLARVRVVDLATGEDGEVPASALDLGYRRSAVTSTQVVVWAEFALAHGDVATTEAEVRDVVRWRREHQPGGQNAGSVFTNPPEDSAGRLIEAAGAKGLRVGTAEVSPKHANFIQAEPGGSADDVARLIEEVRRLVSERCGVELTIELQMVGFAP